MIVVILVVERREVLAEGNGLDRRLSASRKWEQFFHNRLGPDSFYVEGIGPEIVAAQRHEYLKPQAQMESPHFGAYRVALRLETSGTYLVRATHIFAGFQAVSEVSSSGISKEENSGQEEEEEEEEESVEPLNTVIFEESVSLEPSRRKKKEPKTGKSKPSDQMKRCKRVSGKWVMGEVSSSPSSSSIESSEFVWTSPCLPVCLLSKASDLVNCTLGQWKQMVGKGQSKTEGAMKGPEVGIWWEPLPACELPEWGGLPRAGCLPPSSSSLSTATTGNLNAPQSSSSTSKNRGVRRSQKGRTKRGTKAKEQPQTRLSGEQCLRGQSILFQGDSHLQKTVTKLGEWFLGSRDFEGVKAMPVLCENLTDLMPTAVTGAKETWLKLRDGSISSFVPFTCIYRREFNTDDHNNNYNNKENDVVLAFSLSRHGEPSLVGYDDFDAVVVNFGHWPVAEKVRHGGHWSLGKYWRQMRKLVKVLMTNERTTSHGDVPQVIVWVSSVAFPEKFLLKVGDGRKTADWRNNVRLDLMNLIAQREIEKANQLSATLSPPSTVSDGRSMSREIQILDGFGLTFPLKVSEDNNHYVGLQQEVILRYLINHLCSHPRHSK